jgi:hypothetical protein
MKKYPSIRAGLFWLVSAGALVLVVVLLNFPETADWLKEESRTGALWPGRGLDTHLELWKNGYLGTFFRFSKNGVLVWTAIPLFFHYLFRGLRRDWRAGLVFTLFCAVSIVCWQGFINWRYQYTLVPFLVTISLLYLHERWGNPKPVVIGAAIAVFVILWGINYHQLSDKLIRSAEREYKGGVHFPGALLRYINDLPETGGVILELNQPLIYYYTDKRALHFILLYHTDPRLEDFKSLYKDPEAAYRLLREREKVEYILMRDEFPDWPAKKHLYDALGEVMRRHAVPIMHDGSLTLYRLNPPSNEAPVKTRKATSPG